MRMMGLKLLWLTVILLGLESYSRGPSSHSPGTKNRIPVVLDTSGIQKNVYPDNCMDFASYDPMYIGPKADTFYIFYKGNGLYSPSVKGFQKQSYSYDERALDYKLPSANKVVLTVDTSRFMSAWPVLMDSTVDGITYEVPISYKAYPVIIENKSHDSIKIGHSYTLLLLLEAKDKDGSWRPIEMYNSYWGPDSMGMFLPPHQIAITSVNLTAGKFETKLRLRYNNSFSNEFTGAISPTQFEDEYDENGNRKSLPKN